MPMLQLISWLPWPSHANLDDETLTYLWTKELDALLPTLLASPAQRTVHLSGPAEIVEHYLPGRADRADDLGALVQSGRLSIGPWYAQPAPVVSSGEALVRNLIMGTALARQLGAEPEVCLLLPWAVCAGQLPQIVSQFDIGAIVMPLQEAAYPHRQLWRGADGSEIPVVWLPQLEPPPHDQVAVPAGAAGRGTLEGILGALPPPGQVVTGELLACTTASTFQSANAAPGGGDTMTAGYASAWPGLRLAMWEAQSLLERWAEPWSVAAWLSGAGYPAHFLVGAWRHVLRNHRRDAWGGCAAGFVLRHMLVRAERAQRLAEALLRGGLSLVTSPEPVAAEPPAASHGQALPLWVVNPLAWPRSEVVTAELNLPSQAEHLELRSDDGQAIPYQLHHTEPLLPPATTPANHAERRFTISFRADDIPATGFRRFWATPSVGRPYFMGESIAAGNTLENRYLRVSVRPNGALRIEDKRTGRTYDNCNVFEDGGDAGTPQAFCPPEQDRLFTTYAAHAQISIVENGIFAGTIQVRHELSLPSELHPSRQTRSEDRVALSITSYVTLRQGAAQVEVHTQVVNRACDHRLRVLFSSGIPARNCYAAQPFDVTERATGLLDRGRMAPLRQALPTLEFIDINDGRHGLMVATRGLYEYEVKPTPAGTIAVTLWRAIASRRDATGGHQEAELLRFDYTIIPHQGTWYQAVRTAWGFCAPPRTFTAEELTTHHAPSGPGCFSLAALEPAPLMLSALKRSEDGLAVIVRAYNPTGDAMQGQLTTGWPIAGAHLARLDETPLAQLECPEPRRLVVPFAPHQIVTMRLVPRDRPGAETP